MGSLSESSKRKHLLRLLPDLPGMPRPVLCKRDSAAEAEVQSWIESVLGEKFPEGKAYEDALKDGVILCRLMNTLQPGIVKKIIETGPNFKMMENINRFHEALLNYGVEKHDLFQTNDLSEKKDIANVTNTLFALGRAVAKHPEWTGPTFSAAA